MQAVTARHVQRAYLGKAPTLTTVRQAYGRELLEVWIMVQLESVNDFCGATQKMEIPQMKELATIIATEYHHLKTSELLLFFHRLKCGEYGHFYGAIDPQRIALALITFGKERITEMMHYERKQQQIELDQQRSQWAQENVSRQQYEQMKAEKNG